MKATKVIKIVTEKARITMQTALMLSHSFFMPEYFVLKMCFIEESGVDMPYHILATYAFEPGDDYVEDGH